MTSAERRQLGFVLRDYYAARYDDVERELRRMAGDHAPEPRSRIVVTPQIRRDFVSSREGVGVGESQPCNRPVRSPVKAQPKPRKRLVDRTALKEYARTHPECEVIGCEASPCPEPHHLISRKMKGDDVPSNLLRLCFMHHAAWHRNGPKTWLVGYGNRLTADTRSKVAAALRIA